jgi:hypothetical protein
MTVWVAKVQAQRHKCRGRSGGLRDRKQPMHIVPKREQRAKREEVSDSVDG